MNASLVRFIIISAKPVPDRTNPTLKCPKLDKSKPEKTYFALNRGTEKKALAFALVCGEYVRMETNTENETVKGEWVQTPNASTYFAARVCRRGGETWNEYQRRGEAPREAVQLKGTDNQGRESTIELLPEFGLVTYNCSYAYKLREFEFGYLDGALATVLHRSGWYVRIN